jgi:hypothetical protein
MADLITIAQLKTYLQINHTDDDTLLEALITDVSALIEAYCQRSMSEEDVVAYFDGGGRAIVLARVPVKYINSIADLAGRIESLKNPNFDGNADDWTLGTNWAYAGGKVTHTAGVGATFTAAITQSGILATSGKAYLVRYTVTGLTALSIATITASIGNVSGQATTADGMIDEIIWCTGGTDEFKLTPSADFDGSIQNVSLIELTGYFKNVDAYELDAAAGLLRPRPAADDDFWYNDQPSIQDKQVLLWPDGIRRYRIDYRGGEASVPVDVAFACKLWCAAIYQQRDAGVKEETEGDRGTKREAGMPSEVKRILSRYRTDVGF